MYQEKSTRRKNRFLRLIKQFAKIREITGEIYSPFVELNSVKFKQFYTIKKNEIKNFSINHLINLGEEEKIRWNKEHPKRQSTSIAAFIKNLDEDTNNSSNSNLTHDFQFDQPWLDHFERFCLEHSKDNLEIILKRQEQLINKFSGIDLTIMREARRYQESRSYQEFIRPINILALKDLSEKFRPVMTCIEKLQNHIEMRMHKALLRQGLQIFYPKLYNTHHPGNQFCKNSVCCLIKDKNAHVNRFGISQLKEILSNQEEIFSCKMYVPIYVAPTGLIGHLKTPLQRTDIRYDLGANDFKLLRTPREIVITYNPKNDTANAYFLDESLTYRITQED